jgi:ferredoxin-NADP reductase
VSSKVDHFPQVGHPVLGYPSRLLSRTWVAKNTVAFQFQRPRNFLFQPGQSIYVAGPPSMVLAAHQTLIEFAVPEEDIRTEHFAGY